MEKSSMPSLDLDRCFIKEVNAVILEEPADDNTQVQLFFQEDSDTYKKEGLVFNRILVDLIIDNVQIKLEARSGVLTNDNSMEYEKFINSYVEQLVQPVLSKASILITEILERMTEFPRAVDLYSGFIFDETSEDEESEK